MRTYHILITYLLCSLLTILSACRPSSDRGLDGFNCTVFQPTHATGFSIRGAEGKASTLITISNPWQGAEDVQLHCFVARNDEQPPAGFKGQVVRADAKRIVCMASGYITMLDALGETDRVVAVSGLDFVSNAYIQAHRSSIRDVGAEPDYEMLLSLRPDVVLLYGIADAQSALTGKLEELGIPYLYMGEYVEESPLGKAEWLAVVGELTDRREQAEQILQDIAARYDSLCHRVETVASRPTVMLNTPWQDSWTMPSTRSYMVRLITDAGGDYIYKQNHSNASQNIGLETAYRLTTQADYWLNVGAPTTLDELKAMHPKFAEAKAVQTGRVYNNNRRLTPGGGNDFWESSVLYPDVVLSDLIRILHPELSTDSLYYYRQLN